MSYPDTSPAFMAPRLAQPVTIFWCVLAILAANAGLYSFTISSAIIQADAWHFLDTFVRNYYDGTLSWRSFFATRSADDHAQPLQRLVLLFHLRYFQLDFKIEGLVGWLFGILSAVALFGVHRATVPLSARRAPFYAAACASTSVLLSLNSTNTYTWPLVTMGFSAILFGILAVGAAWRLYVTGNGIPALLLAVTATCLVGDKFAILAALSLALSLLLAVQGKADLKRWLVTIAAAVVPIAIVAIAVKLSVLPTAGTAPAPPFSQLVAVMSKGVRPWIEALLVPLSSSVLYDAGWFVKSEPLRDGIEIGLGLAMAAAHLTFWWTVVRHRKTAGLAGIIACWLMLLTYASCAGVILRRVPDFGAEYMRQPRYVTLYALSAIACLVWFTALICRDREGGTSAHGSRRRIAGLALFAASIAIVALQVPLSIRAWDLVKYVSAYQQVAATQLGRLAADPSVAPKGCVDILIVCNLPVAKRADLMGILKSHELNVFSRDFQLRYRLYPTIEGVPRTSD